MKSKYIEMRNSQKYYMEWFYNYYREKGGKLRALPQFSQIFNTGNLDAVLEHIDHEFNLNILFDKDGKYVKCYE